MKARALASAVLLAKCEREANVPMFAAKLYEREAFRYIFAYGGTIADLKDKRVNNVPAAVANAHAITGELLGRLRNGNKPVEEAA